MTELPWDRLKEICLRALELPPGERGAYLDGACEGDATLRREVEGLLAEHDPDFLEEPIVGLGLLHASERGEVPEEGRRIGPYRVVRPIGSGGMGEVLLAIQEGEGFERPVAIKLVRPGMASADVLERFRLERRILASLEHPNLARLIEGGATQDGQPYFVMEHVEGLPITEYCDRRALGVEERLHLFSSVCEAVQHAHQSLVVHRDIKPSNILVTADGTPKLLDFGIGKVLDAGAGEDVTVTAAARRVLTPAYAAPEQLAGAEITTATDVHGLGVLLYELLTGRHPFGPESSTAQTREKALLEETPTAPSTVVTLTRGAPSDRVASASEIARSRGSAPSRLARRLRGDLDNIVLKALRKEPHRRYSSAEALKADVERHLAGRPVLARPDSLGYRLSKLATRNPWGVVAAGLAVVAIGLAVVLPWRQNIRLTEERDKALEVQGFLLEAFGTTGGEEAVSARDLLDLQAGRVEELYPNAPDLRVQMYLVLAEAYDRLGLFAEAKRMAEQGLELAEATYESDAPEHGRALNAMGWALHRLGEGEEGASYLEEAVSMRRRLGRSERRDLARSLNDLGVVVATLGDNGRAAELHREALGIRRTVLGDTDRATGVSANNLAAALYGAGDLEGATENTLLALELLRASVGPDHQRTILAQSNLAVLMQVAGDHSGAEEVYRDLLARQSRLQGPTHPLTNQVRSNLVNALIRQERWTEAETLVREVIDIARSQGDAGLDRELTGVSYLSTILIGLGRAAEALPILEEAISRAELRRAGRPIVRTLMSAQEQVLAQIGG